MINPITGYDINRDELGLKRNTQSSYLLPEIDTRSQRVDDISLKDESETEWLYNLKQIEDVSN